MRRYTLLVKGNACAAIKAAQQRGFAATHAEWPHPGETIIRVEAADDLTAKLNAWFCEELHAPFGEGSLLFWREKTTALDLLR